MMDREFVAWLIGLMDKLKHPELSIVLFRYSQECQTVGLEYNNVITLDVRSWHSVYPSGRYAPTTMCMGDREHDCDEAEHTKCCDNEKAALQKILEYCNDGKIEIKTEAITIKEKSINKYKVYYKWKKSNQK
jgi:hypothetical protein